MYLPAAELAGLALVVRGEDVRHIVLNSANALEQRFLSRVSDRRLALSGRSPIEAATHAAMRQREDLNGGKHEQLAVIPDGLDVVSQLAAVTTYAGPGSWPTS